MLASTFCTWVVSSVFKPLEFTGGGREKWDLLGEQAGEAEDPHDPWSLYTAVRWGGYGRPSFFFCDGF